MKLAPVCTPQVRTEVVENSPVPAGKRPIHFLPLLGVLLAGQLLGANPGLDARRVGIYHWGGRISRSVAQGVDAIADVGARVVRITLSPRYLRDYNMATNCVAGFSLQSAATDPEIDRALSRSNIDVVMITAYDGTSFGDCETHRFLNPDFFTTEHRAAVVAEYSDFALYLSRKFRNTHKRFILSTWEGDNQVYCGAAYQYVEDASFRQYCNENYSQLYGGVRAPDIALAGLRIWLQARYDGIADGRRRAQGESIGGVRVYSAPEMNAVRVLREHGYPSVLYDVLPFVNFDYVSYSAWESINVNEPVPTLREDLNRIRDVVGSTAIIIGESGFNRNSSGPQVVTRVDEVLRAALDWGVEYVIHWQLFDQDENWKSGLYDLNGAPTPFESYFRTLLQ